MSCNKYSLLNICVFLKAGPQKKFSFNPVRSSKKVADPCSNTPFQFSFPTRKGLQNVARCSIVHAASRPLCKTLLAFGAGSVWRDI